tara:strand:+ start:85 stop:675 length:591 start_codon:yes stop_codon:yes gene_type:complete
VKVLVACEYSGVVRNAFTARGHDAWSCDILETESPGQHYKCDVLEILDQNWDLMIAHPPCTFLTNAGNRWFYDPDDKEKPHPNYPERWADRDDAIKFFLSLQNAPIEKIAIENPLPNPYVTNKTGKHHQLVQPWMFGHPESKGICLWLKNLGPLFATMVEEVREQKMWKLPPSEDRWKLRSKTYTGFADAMAKQWG